MLTIRFLRQGRRNRAFFRIVLTESSKSSKSGFIKVLGWYDPKTKETSLKKEEILNWVKCGAKPSNQLAKLLIKEKVSHKNIRYIPNAPKAKKIKEPARNASPARQDVVSGGQSDAGGEKQPKPEAPKKVEPDQNKEKNPSSGEIPTNVGKPEPEEKIDKK